MHADYANSLHSYPQTIHTHTRNRWLQLFMCGKILTLSYTIRMITSLENARCCYLCQCDQSEPIGPPSWVCWQLGIEVILHRQGVLHYPHKLQLRIWDCTVLGVWRTSTYHPLGRVGLSLIFCAGQDWNGIPVSVREASDHVFKISLKYYCITD